MEFYTHLEPLRRLDFVYCLTDNQCVFLLLLVNSVVRLVASPFRHILVMWQCQAVCLKVLHDSRENVSSGNKLCIKILNQCDDVQLSSFPGIHASVAVQ